MGNACSGSSTIAHGYRQPDAKWRTIMAYGCQANQCDNNPGTNCPRIQRFSNPDLQYEGDVIGTSLANCAKRINDGKQTIAAYYQSCRDDNNSCSVWAQSGYCNGQWSSYMRDHCKLSCGVCSTKPTSPPTQKPTSPPTAKPTIISCRDDYNSCSGWAQSGYCNGQWSSYMRDHCKLSCGVCS